MAQISFTDGSRHTGEIQIGADIIQFVDGVAEIAEEKIDALVAAFPQFASVAEIARHEIEQAKDALTAAERKAEAALKRKSAATAVTAAPAPAEAPAAAADAAQA